MTLLRNSQNPDNIQNSNVSDIKNNCSATISDDSDTNTSENKNTENTENTENIDAGIDVNDSKGKIHCLTIIGEIEGHSISPQNAKTTKYEHVIPELIKIEEDNTIKGLLLILNTVGGDVEAGLAIAELISSMKKPTVSIVLGGGHSIGVPLAVSAKKSFIVPSAAMTVHPIRTSGTIITAYQTFNQMERLQDRVIEFVSRHSKISKDNLKRIMLDTENISNDVGTILYGDEAVKCGLIDSLGGLSDALEFLKSNI